MTLQYLEDEDLLLVAASEIDTFITNLSSYQTIAITGDYNCGATSVLKTYTIDEIVDNTNYAYILSGNLYLKPQMFAQTTFTDGIYKVIVKMHDANFTIIQTCIFIDITYKCKVADHLAELIEENRMSNNTDKRSTIVHLLHYSLIVSSNCGCNCDDMCIVFKELQKLLGSQSIKSNCGC
jgi:hypothetical protein